MLRRCRASDAGASSWQTLTNVVIPLCKPGIAIGSIFVITIVMGDFITIGVMGGQQLASIGKIIQVETSYLQFPAAAANAVSGGKPMAAAGGPSGYIATSQVQNHTP